MSRPRLVAVVAAAALLAGCTSHTAHPVTSADPAQPVVPAHASVPAARTSSPTPGTAPPTSRATPPTRAATPRTVTVLGSGDVLIHPPVWQQARADARDEGRDGYDFGPMLAGVKPVTESVDLATCELETPLATPQGPFAGYPDFDAPPEVLTALKNIGYRSCTTASNHTLDDGAAGVTRTLDELDAAGLKHTGSARSAAEAAMPLILTMPNGVKVAQLAYTFGLNGNALPAGAPWLANLIDVPKILAAAHRAKRAGADIVVLSLHWGTEYDHLATALQKQQAEQLLASPDIDVILGDHAHVIQPMQEIHGKWVIYCMGNQLARHAEPTEANREGVMPIFTFTEAAPHHFRITHVEAVPTWMQLTPKIRLIDLRTALDDPATPATERMTYRHACDQIRHYLDAYGAAEDGLVVAS